MVGDDERIGPQGDGLLGLRRGQDALDHQGQAGLIAQPAQVVPSGCLLGQRRAEQDGALQRAGVLRGRHAAQVGGLHPGRQGEARALDAGVHRPDQGGVAGGFGAAHQLQAVLAVGLQVELEPARCALAQFLRGLVGGGGNGFQRVAGQGADHHAGLQRHGGLDGGQLARRVHQLLVGHGRQQQRAVQRLAQQRAAGVGLLQLRQRLGQQAQLVEGGAVVGQGQALVRAPLDVLPGLGLHMVDGMPLVIGGMGDVRRDLCVGGAHGGAQGVEGSHGCQASDHMRNRLW